jgi:plastocyanin
MADNSFGIKELNLIDSGTPKIESPNNLNINAVNVAISTNATVGGTLDVDGHTELDDVNVSGVSTFVGNIIAGSGVTISPDGHGFFTGVVTSTSFSGDGSALTGIAVTANVRTGILDVAGIATFRSNTLVGSGITLSPDGHAFVSGITTVGRQIVGISTNNLVPFLFNNYSDLPSASDYHGQFAHVHIAGKAFYAHAGAWYELVNVGSDLTVGLGTEKYNVGILTATSINVGTGVTISSDGDSFVTGVSTATKFVGDLSDSAISRWSVGNNGFSHYTFTGPGGLSSAEDPTIYLARGQTYEFNLNASGHPFQIQTTSGGYNASNVYTTGITNAGAAVGVIKFEVPFSAPNTLYYVCQNHSNMAGTIVIYPSI